MKIKYNKLARDKIPQLIEASGRKQTSRVLNEEEYFHALIDKVVEEIEEFRLSGIEEEIADVYEVLDCLVKLKDYEMMHIDYIRLIKRDAMGSYMNRILLEEVDDGQDEETYEEK